MSREIPYLQAAMYYLVYYINILMTTILTIFQKFPKIFRRSPKILQKPGNPFLNIFRKSLKIYEDNRRFTRSEEDLMIFRSYSYTFLNVKVHFKGFYVIIATVAFSLVKITCYLFFRVKLHYSQHA